MPIEVRWSLAWLLKQEFAFESTSASIIRLIGTFGLLLDIMTSNWSAKVKNLYKEIGHSCLTFIGYVLVNKEILIY